MKYILYTRYSPANSRKSKADNKEDRKKEDDSRLTHEMQLRDMLTLVGDEEYIHFTESNISGRAPIEKCPKLLEALDCVKKGDVFMVWKIDRLSRDMMKKFIVKARIVKIGGSLVSFSEKDLFGDDLNGEMVENMMMVFAEHQGNMIRHNIRKALQTKKELGGRVGHIPYGYRLSEALKIVPDAKEQGILEVMSELYFSSRYTYRQVAEYLYKEDILNRKECPWSPSAVYRTIKRRDLHADFYMKEARNALPV